MKNAVIVVGSHYSGKSRTIKKFAKPKLGIGKDKRNFKRNDFRGVALVQTFEEADKEFKQP